MRCPSRTSPPPCGTSSKAPYVAAQAMSGAIPAQIIPAETYFVLGDNRNDSLDSRSWGVLPRDTVVGRARMVLWSSDARGGSGVVAAASPTPDSPQPAAASSSRFFKLIQ